MSPRPNLVERRMNRFLRKAPSVRSAAGVIVTAMVVVIGIGAVAIRLLDHTEYPSMWKALWWATQTVTTVGYGDVTPEDHRGQVVAAFVMLEGIAFIAITTAVVTSAFVARAEEARGGGLERQLAELTRRFDEFDAFLKTGIGGEKDG
jgi:voltage-gated potassium channel Kch